MADAWSTGKEVIPMRGTHTKGKELWNPVRTTGMAFPIIGINEMQGGSLQEKTSAVI